MAVDLAAAFARYEQKVLLVDMDPQGSLTEYFINPAIRKLCPGPGREFAAVIRAPPARVVLVERSVSGIPEAGAEPS